MSLDALIDCEDVYNRLRDTLLSYSDTLASAEIEIFAVEMEVTPGSRDSTDPALKDEFLKLCSGSVPLREALLRSAQYVENELVALRQIESAKRVVGDLRAVAAHSPADIPDPLRRWMQVPGNE